MGTFIKSTTLKGKYKNIIATEDGFIDDETGELINLAKELHDQYKDTPFNLTTDLKTEE